jgi:hypothetical protein
MIWLKEGDACTKFFHLKANGHRRRNYIPCLKKENGDYAWTHGEKEEVLFSYLQNILGAAETRVSPISWVELQMPQLAPSHHLDRPFDEDEIRISISD